MGKHVTHALLLLSVLINRRRYVGKIKRWLQERKGKEKRKEKRICLPE